MWPSISSDKVVHPFEVNEQYPFGMLLPLLLAGGNGLASDDTLTFKNLLQRWD